MSLRLHCGCIALVLSLWAFLSWFLSSVSPLSVSLADFGDHEDDYVSVKTEEAQKIAEQIGGSVDLLLKRRICTFVLPVTLDVYFAPFQMCLICAHHVRADEC